MRIQVREEERGANAISPVRKARFVAGYMSRACFARRYSLDRRALSSTGMFGTHPDVSSIFRYNIAHHRLATLVVILIPRSQAGRPQAAISFICFIQSYSRFSLRGPMYFLLLSSPPRFVIAPPHLRNLYFCYYWKSSSPSGAR